MAEFDPDAYLATDTSTQGFDPDAYLATPTASTDFDPDAYLAQDGEATTKIGEGVALVETPRGDSDSTLESIGEFGMGVVGELHKRGLGPSVTAALAGLGIETDARPEDFPEATLAQKVTAEIVRDATDPLSPFLGLAKSPKIAFEAMGLFGAASEGAGQVSEFGEVVDGVKMLERGLIDGTFGYGFTKAVNSVVGKFASKADSEQLMLDVTAVARDKMRSGADAPIAFKEAALELGVDTATNAKAARGGAQRGAQSLARSADELTELNRVIDEDLALTGSLGQRSVRALTESGMVQRPLRVLRDSGFVRVADDALGILSTQLANKSPKIAKMLRVHELAEHTAVGNTFKNINPWVTAVKNLRKTAPAQARALDEALLNANVDGGFGAAEDIMARNGMPMNAWATVRQELEAMRTQLIEVGQTELGLDNFFPRHVKDLDGLRHAVGEEPSGAIEQALKAAAIRKKSSGGGIGELTPAEASKVINGVLRGSIGDNIGSPLSKGRTVNEVTPDLAKYYDNIEDSLGDYLANAHRDTMSRKFWGNTANGKATDGGWTPQLREELAKLSPDDQRTVEGLLEARLAGAAKPTGSVTNHFKNLSYLTTVADPLVAQIQWSDIPLAAYKNGMGSTIKAAYQAVRTGRASAVVDKVLAKYPNEAGKLLAAIQRGGADELATTISRMDIPVSEQADLIRKMSSAQTRLQGSMDVADVGLVDHIAAEITKDRSALAKATHTMFKATGFAKLDRFGKRVHMNGSLNKLKKMTPEKMLEKYGDAYADMIPKAHADIQAGNFKTDEVLGLIWNDLLDMQPITLSELPPMYLKHPQLRAMYVLKSFGLKQMDIIRRDALGEMAKGNVGKGVKNLMTLTAATTVGMGSYRAAMDTIHMKDDVDTSDRVLDAMLGMVMLSKYSLDTVGSGDLAGFVSGQIVPASVDLYGNVLGTMATILDSDKEFEAKFAKNLPIVKHFAAREKNQ